MLAAPHSYSLLKAVFSRREERSCMCIYTSVSCSLNCIPDDPINLSFAFVFIFIISVVLPTAVALKFVCSLIYATCLCKVKHEGWFCSVHALSFLSAELDWVRRIYYGCRKMLQARGHFLLLENLTVSQLPWLGGDERWLLWVVFYVFYWRGDKCGEHMVLVTLGLEGFLGRWHENQRRGAQLNCSKG